VARALLLKPKLIVADEPVSMVDALLRATILGSSRRLADEYGISILYITHDLATAYQVSDSRSSGNSITFSARLCDTPDLR
jgi:ABC-type glutathione transport system ATPase component